MSVTITVMITRLTWALMSDKKSHWNIITASLSRAYELTLSFFFFFLDYCISNSGTLDICYVCTKASMICRCRCNAQRVCLIVILLLLFFQTVQSDIYGTPKRTLMLIFWYQKFDFLISENIFWYKKNRNFWYQKIISDIRNYFLISENTWISDIRKSSRFSDIKNWISDIRN